MKDPCNDPPSKRSRTSEQDEGGRDRVEKFIQGWKFNFSLKGTKERFALQDFKSWSCYIQRVEL